MNKQCVLLFIVSVALKNKREVVFTTLCTKVCSMINEILLNRTLQGRKSHQT